MDQVVEEHMNLNSLHAEQQLQYQLADGWNPKVAVENFIIPEEYEAAELPKGSKLKSPLYDFGVKVLKKENRNCYWFCCASKVCYDRRVIISIRKSTSMATQHLQQVHGLAQTEKRGPRRSTDESNLFAYSEAWGPAYESHQPMKRVRVLATDNIHLENLYLPVPQHVSSHHLSDMSRGMNASGVMLSHGRMAPGALLCGEQRELPMQEEASILPYSASITASEQQQESVIPHSHGDMMSNKRMDAICWDDYFMSIAFLSAMRSKDPSTQVGACIVSPDRRIVGIGYNGFPRGCSDDDLPWARVAENPLDTKYPYVCHAEVNAILNKNSADVKDCSIYVALFPCNECAKVIIQSGITEVVYMSDKYHDTPAMQASKRMLGMAKVRCRQYVPAQSSIVINFGGVVL